MRLCLQVGFLTTFAILLHEIPHEVRLAILYKLYSIMFRFLAYFKVLCLSQLNVVGNHQISTAHVIKQNV